MIAEISRALSLRLELYRAEDLPLDRFTVYARREVSLPGGRAILHAIGASSLVVVERNGLAYAELIACREGAPTERQPLGARPLREGGTPLAAYPGGLRYTGHLWTEPLRSAQPAREWGAGALEYRFGGEASPLTRIQVHASRDGSAGSLYTLTTLHEYPEDALAVWSRSDWWFDGA